jgi:thiol-disulfide isomerase/thioredoxin
MKKTLLTLASFLLLGASAFAQATNYPNGSTVADFTVTDVDGNTHNLYSITASGKYVVLDFFFANCGPCQGTAPLFNEFHEKYGCNAGQVHCLSINSGIDNVAAVQNYENLYGGTFSHAPITSQEGGTGPVDVAFGVNAYPTFVLISPNNVMLVNDIWPIGALSDIEDAFNGQTTLTPLACTATNVEEVAAEIAFSLSPNPAHEVLNIAYNAENASTVQISVFNILGERLSQQNEVASSGSNQASVNIEQLPQGAYFVQLNIDGQVKAQRFEVLR